MTQDFRLNGWALILGASSGFGEAVSLELARRGMSIIGVHLDRRATMPHVESIQARIREAGGEAWFFNINAADEQKRRELLAEVHTRFADRKKGESVQVLLHSLAFGTLKPYWSGDRGSDPGPGILNKANIDMTLDVMANSLVYWTQDALREKLLGLNARIFAMTSAGGSLVWSGYGAVSAAKAALESHTRQLAVELAPLRITANAICAGVTDTPALRKIPGSDSMIANATHRNPYKRLTTPDDVAKAISVLSLPETHWITGNTLYVDGGEFFSG